MHVSNSDVLAQRKMKGNTTDRASDQTPTPLPWGELVNGIYQTVTCVLISSFGEVGGEHLLTWSTGKSSLFYLLVTYWKQ